jgi:hypothetical protein
MKRFPKISTATPAGYEQANDAEVAGSPSPEKPHAPLPATVVMILCSLAPVTVTVTLMVLEGGVTSGSWTVMLPW